MADRAKRQAKLRFTILGCGSSPGVPRIHGEWGACDPTNPKNRRTRCSLMVERFGRDGTTRMVVDTSPDFRHQMIAAKASHLDAVLYTHPHADHLHGIDDLRQFALLQRKRMPIYADRPTLDHLKRSFSYCFEAPDGSMYPPICEAHEINCRQPLCIEGAGGAISALPIRQVHGPIHSLAFRFGFSADRSGAISGGVAYSPDVSDLEAGEAEKLRNLDVWIVDALQYRPHISHFSLSQSLDWINRLGAKKAYLTHMHIPLDYETVDRETPDHVTPSHDGLAFDFEYEEEIPVGSQEIAELKASER